jgi:rSAM/selenodomain-associated transferase 2/rSAM/selenodomain-associated transferase 1
LPAEALVLFARFPEPGKVKTRLIPSLGAESAAREHRLMVEHALTQARIWRELSPGRVYLAGDVGKRSHWRAWLGKDFIFLAQAGRDLGEKMAQAAARAFQGGARRVVVIGSDCPGLKPSHLQKAFKALETHDLVLGPAADGGYYLLGLRSPAGNLFAQVDWGTHRVFSQTQQNARAQHWSVAKLETLSDVDTPQDLKHWTRIREQAGAGISVIIPAWNEAETIAQTVKQARRARRAEVLVVDGGSTDATRSLARVAGARVVPAPRGRAPQLIAGAARARGKIFLFLHADTLLPEGYDISLREVLSRPAVALGAFSLHVAAKENKFRWVEKLVGFRARVLGWPYGDQGLFLSRETYGQIQGFPDQPILEDVGLVKRARSWGRVAVAREAVLTSPRRWRRWGIAKTFLVHQLVWLGCGCGVSLQRLSQWYRGLR